MTQSQIAAQPSRRMRLNVRASTILGRVALYLALVLLGLTFALPLLWMMSTSVKTDPQVYRVPPIWIPNPMRFLNYVDVLTRRPFGLWFVNTMRYCIPSTIGVLLSSVVVAYSFSRIRWWGRDALFFLCIATMMIPFQVQMIPLYIIFRNMQWINSYKPLVVPTFFGNHDILADIFKRLFQHFQPLQTFVNPRRCLIRHYLIVKSLARRLGPGSVFKRITVSLAKSLENITL